MCPTSLGRKEKKLSNVHMCSVTMSPQPVTMSPPLSFSILQQGEKCQKSAPSLPTSAQNLSLHHFHGVQFNGVLKALSQGLTRPSRNQPGYQILAFHLSMLCKYCHCETQQWFSDPHRRLATSSVNINMCPQSTLLHGTAFYLTYFTTNYFSNDLGNGSFKDLRGVIVSSKHCVLTLQTVHITHAMNCPMH